MSNPFRFAAALACCLLLVPAASAGGRKETRQALSAELATLAELLAATDQLEPFCPRELRALERRLEPLRTRAAAPSSDAGAEAALLAELHQLREELDVELAPCRETGLRVARRAVDELGLAVAAARELLAAGAGSVGPSAELLVAEDTRTQALPALLERGRYREAMELARSTATELEQSVLGTSCEDELALAEHRLALGSAVPAVEALCALAARTCLDPRWPQAALERLDELAATVPDLGSRAGARELAASLAACRPARYAETLAALTAAPAPASAEPEATAEAAVPTGEPAAPAASLCLDVWQSAWGDFAELSSLGEYLERNRIREVNLNPGIAMKRELEAAGYATLRPLVDELRRAGVETVNFLYAELGYEVGAFAAFLARHPELGIGKLVDDSELTDPHLERFEANRAAVKAAGLAYAAFVTVESAGNSGVSDSTRRWAIRELDEVILMSYFGCTLTEQRDHLEPWLELADGLGKKGSVKIAILLGGKSVGREVSCEQELDAAGLQQLLRQLHGWASGHPSYGGIVLETNQRLPAHDVAPAGLD